MTRRAYLIAGIGAALAIGLAFAYCRAKPSTIPPNEQFSIDSAKATEPGFKARVETLTVRESIYVRESRQNRAGAARTSAVADSLRRVAIVAERRAQAASDSGFDAAQQVAGWKLTAASYRDEATTLRTANDSLARAYSAESSAHRAAELRAMELGARLLAASDLNSRLAKDLARSSPPCRVLWVLGCPSRKVAFAAGAVVASAGAYVVTHRSQLKGVVP